MSKWQERAFIKHKIIMLNSSSSQLNRSGHQEAYQNPILKKISIINDLN